MIQLSQKLLNEIQKYKGFARWSHRFPPSIEKHYFDGILVYFHDRTNPDKTYSDSIVEGAATPILIVVRYDQQLVFVKHRNSVLLDRLPMSPCSTQEQPK